MDLFNWVSVEDGWLTDVYFRSMDWYEASIACSDTQSVSHNDEDGRKRKFGALR